MIVFQNPGEIDVRSISTFGVSVKESDNPIGFFGTGLKYAIAVLLRTGHKVTIHSGRSVLTFGVQKDAVRGQAFDFVTMAVDGGEPSPIGFTTELGKTWELWMAYREIACNCKDEAGSGRFTKTKPAPEPGSTQIIVEGQDFEAVYSDGHRYILADEPSLTIGTTEVRFRRSNHLFYRGVRVMEFPRTSLYTYNLNDKIELTEDRTVKEPWAATSRLARAVLQAEDVGFIRTVVTADENFLEGSLDLHGWGTPPSKQFLQVVGEALAERMCKVNPTAMRVWQDATKQTISPVELALSKVQQTSLTRAIEFCERMGYPVRNYPIKAVESLGDGCLGLAQDSTIFIAERAFQIGGAKQLAATLIEEYLHLRHGWKDCTRDMQNYLFEKLVSVGEELVGEPL
jgi:hypothetical protein